MKIKDKHYRVVFKYIDGDRMSICLEKSDFEKLRSDLIYSAKDFIALNGRFIPKSQLLEVFYYEEEN